jgi:hypothetical protein
MRLASNKLPLRTKFVHAAGRGEGSGRGQVEMQLLAARSFQLFMLILAKSYAHEQRS